MIKSRRTDVVTTYKSIRNLSACVEKRGELGWVVGCSLGEERWDGEEEGEEEGETEEESVGRVGYTGFYQWNHRRTRSVSDSVGESATSLYGYPGLNFLVIPSVKSYEKNPRHHTVAIRRRYGWYIPTDVFHRYIPTISPWMLSVGIYRQSLRQNYVRR